MLNSFPVVRLTLSELAAQFRYLAASLLVNRFAVVIAMPCVLIRTRLYKYKHTKQRARNSLFSSFAPFNF